MSTALSDSSEEPQISVSIFDILLIELVPLAERLARAYEESLDSVEDRPHMRKDPRKTSSGTASAHGTSNPPRGSDQEQESEVFRESVYFRLESLGFRVGQGLSERFSRDRPHFTDHLDVIKFLCKDMWMMIFKKQIDNLKTNHRVRFLFFSLVRSGSGSTCEPVLTTSGSIRPY